MIKDLKNSGEILEVASIKIEVFGYADDTECQRLTAEAVKRCIKLVENFCKREDILLNGKKQPG